MGRLRILLFRPRPPRETIGLQHVMICEPLELEYLAGNINKIFILYRALEVYIIKNIILNILKIKGGCKMPTGRIYGL